MLINTFQKQLFKKIEINHCFIYNRSTFMAISINTLPPELIGNITRFVDRSTLATLKLVSKLFADSNELHEQLFAKEHPNLRITSLPASSWKGLHVSRRLAEQNLLKGFYRIEMLETLPTEAVNHYTWISPQGRLFAIYLEQSSKTTLVIRDLQKQQSISKDLEPLSYYSIQDIQDETYVSIRNFNQFLLYKIGNTLEQVAIFHCETNRTRAFWIKGPNSFQLATTFNNELRVRFTQENSSSKTFNQPPRILGQFFIGEEPFIVVFSDGKLNVYHTATLQDCFSLKVEPHWNIQALKFLKYYESALYLQFNDEQILLYQIPTPSEPLNPLNIRLQWETINRDSFTFKQKFSSSHSSTPSNMDRFILRTHGTLPPENHPSFSAPWPLSI